MEIEGRNSSISIIRVFQCAGKSVEKNEPWNKHLTFVWDLNQRYIWMIFLMKRELIKKGAVFGSLFYQSIMAYFLENKYLISSSFKALLYRVTSSMFPVK